MQYVLFYPSLHVVYMVFIGLSFISNDTNTVSNAENATSGGVAFVLSLITCNIYGLYWAYKQGEKIDKAKTDRGIPSSNSGVIYLILCFVGLGIVAEALMQNELNSLA